MYVFCYIDLYKRKHEIWNQISYEIQEKGLYESKRVLFESPWKKILWWNTGKWVCHIKPIHALSE